MDILRWVTYCLFVFSRGVGGVSPWTLYLTHVSIVQVGCLKVASVPSMSCLALPFPVQKLTFYAVFSTIFYPPHFTESLTLRVSHPLVGLLFLPCLGLDTLFTCLGCNTLPRAIAHPSAPEVWTFYLEKMYYAQVSTKIYEVDPTF